jgi:hypothetical protein
MNQTASTPIVAICIPSGDMVHADFAANLAALCLNPGARTAVINCKGSRISVSRNHLMGAAQKIGATYALFLDTDMVFPLDVMRRLLAHDKDIVGALYASRRPPFQPIGVPWDDAPATGHLRRMKMLPTGCLLINMRVFEKLPKPWFSEQITGDQIAGEDVYFCAQATTAGFEIWQDVSLSREVGHIGEKVFRLEQPA